MVTCDGLASHPGGVVILLVASNYETAIRCGRNELLKLEDKCAAGMRTREMDPIKMCKKEIVYSQ